jgi:hypothetical protein
MGTKNATAISIVVRQQLTLEEAMAGQFALCCCDCVSAFVDDNIVCDGYTSIVEELSAIVTNSAEFSPVTVRVDSIPHTEWGRRFSWQFLGFAVGVATPVEMTVHRKKARLMMHWAPQCGVQMETQK